MFVNKITKPTDLEKKTFVKMLFIWQDQVPDTTTCYTKLFPDKFYIRSPRFALFFKYWEIINV